VYGLTDESGTLKEAYQYDAYGKQTVITNSGGTVLFSTSDSRTVGGSSFVNNPLFYTPTGSTVGVRSIPRATGALSSSTGRSRHPGSRDLRFWRYFEGFWFSGVPPIDWMTEVL
jgi:hypothetical protein